MKGLHYSFQSEEYIHFVMSFIEGGTLFSQVIKREKEFSESEVQFYAGQVLLALETIHEKNIIYRDLKLENILLSLDGFLIIYYYLFYYLFYLIISIIFFFNILLI